MCSGGIDILRLVRDMVKLNGDEHQRRRMVIVDTVRCRITREIVAEISQSK